VADCNRDGKLDLVTVDRYHGTVGVLQGNGDGTLQPAQQYAGVANADLAALADLNSDGFVDLVLKGSGGLWVLRNDANWPPASAPSITLSDVTVAEGNTGTRAAAFTVSLSHASFQPVTVAYATADGTATAGKDYQAISATLTFAPGQTSQTITVPIYGDRLPEPNETFFVNLSQPTGAALVKAQGVGTILDDEPRITIGDVTRSEGQRGQTAFTFTMTLSAAYDVPVTVNYATADGTATVADHDYQAQSGTLTFNPGETTKTITFVVNGDKKREADETLFVELLGSSGNALITKSRGVGTILNDD
jgi:hypothetical protein